jgi:hypothetical protein
MRITKCYVEETGLPDNNWANQFDNWDQVDRTHQKVTRLALYTELKEVWYLELQATQQGIQADLGAYFQTWKANLKHRIKVNDMGMFDRGNGKASRTQYLELLQGMDMALFFSVIRGVVAEGHNFSVSRTKQGGALVISVYDGKENQKAYPENSQELNEVLETIAEYYHVTLPPSQGESDEAPSAYAAPKMTRKRPTKA